LRLNSVLPEQFRLTSIITIQARRNDAYVYQLSRSSHYKHPRTLSSPSYQGLTQIWFLLDHKIALGSRLPSNLHRRSWQAKDGFDH
jgi:hypothetical protein